jgi:cold shock CspA family protein
MNTLPNIIVRPASIIKRATTRRLHIMLGLHSVTTWKPPSTRTTPQGNTRKCTAKKGAGKDVFAHISAVERAGLSGLNEGQVVEYEEVSNKGKTSAENLKVQR